MLRNLVLASALIALPLAASASDLPSKKSPPAAPAANSQTDWTGAYYGLHIGGVKGNTTGTDYDGWLDFPDEVRTLSVDPQGLTAGAQVGYNFQQSQFVYGLEADLSYVGLSEEVTYYNEPFSTALDNHVGSGNGYLGTLRGRLGVTTGSLLVYATAGLAFGDVKSYWVDDGGSNRFSEKVGAQLGWSAGGGAEFEISRGMSLKLEYLHYDLGEKDFTVTETTQFVCAGGGIDTCSFSMKNSGDIIRLGVNKKF